MSVDLPRAYKLGEQEFFGRKFEVTQDVLIPRPETEAAVEMALGLMGVCYLSGVRPTKAGLRRNARILDVGTGSGVIGITLKLENPEAEVELCDISRKALAVAKKNAKNLGAEVRVFESDLMDNCGEYDLVVANLPYVDKNWEWLGAPESDGLKYEPEIALYAGDGGLELIFKLIRQAKEKTKYLILEADPCQHERLIKYAEDFGFLLYKISGFVVGFRLK
ncbi:peptide chain release factor N(5)-glutamine methyltransferase [Candidatus Saccharibacteria bacterium]|nr:peptide chain release factor N(5)-glutamine methyltransferase [Candidatus Saccharibacteria bacterium]